MRNFNEFIANFKSEYRNILLRQKKFFTMRKREAKRQAEPTQEAEARRRRAAKA